MPSYRYETIVEVETPEGLRTGASVTEIKAYAEPQLLPQMKAFVTQPIGQAVVVDLPSNQSLYALLYSESGTGGPETVAIDTLVPSERRPRAPSPREAYSRLANLLNQQNLRGVVKHSSYPVFVRFGDPRDPSTIEAVDPDNLDDTFGAGYRLKRIVVRTTGKPTKTDLDEKLKWLRDKPAINFTSIHGVGVTLPSNVLLSE